MSPGICGWSADATFAGKSSRLMGEKVSALTVSSWTSLPVAMPSRPICPAAFSTASSPTECSKGSGPVATCERTSSAKGRDCGGLSVTRSLRVSGSKRHSETREAEAPFAVSAAAGLAGSSTSVMVAPAGTSRTNSLSSPWAGRMET